METVGVLLKHGADVDTEDVDHKTPLHLAVSKSRRQGAVALLIEHGADINMRDGGHSAPLHIALCCSGTLRHVRLLIEYGADVNVEDGNQNTPLHLVLSQVSVEIVATFDPAWANHDVYDVIPVPLHDQARTYEKADVLRLLIQHGADVNARNKTRSTPLHLASSNSSIDDVRLLIQHGADVIARDEDHSTPLHLAASSYLDTKGNIVRLLLAHGANVDDEDKKGRTPLDIASSKGSFQIARLLSDHNYLSRGV